MNSLYIGSIAPHSGKSLVCLGIIDRLQKDGLKIGYFKPLGTSPYKTVEGIVDEDALFMKEILDLPQPLETLCPIIFNEDLITKVVKGEVYNWKRRVKLAYKKISADKDMLIIDGADSLNQGFILNLSARQVSQEFKAKIILVVRYHPQLILDNLLMVKKVIRERLGGVVINNIPSVYYENIKENLLPFLEKREIPIFALIPRDVVLNSLSIKEIVEHLEAEVLCAEDKLGEMAENLSVGAMSVDSALRYFRRLPNKAVITGGDRSDIQVAALNTPTKCLILTGNLYPSAVILSQAEEKGIPVLVVKDDTLTTTTRIEEIFGKMPLRSEKKVKRAQELINQYFDFEKLYKVIYKKGEK